MRADRITTRIIAAAAFVAAAASFASAQTVVVRNAPAGAPIELFLDADSVASATADSTGGATLTTDVMARLQRPETGVHVFLDVCGQQRRISLVESGAQPAAQGSCSRGTVRDLFSVQRITTLVVDVTGENPIVWIRQGPAPPEWLGGLAAAEAARSWAPPPIGPMVSAGLGGVSFSNAVDLACGDATTCTGQNIRGDVTAAVTFWFNGFVAADIGYLRPANVKVTGSGSTVSFNSALDARVFTIAGKVGGQAGPVRIYGTGGANRLSATATTLQTVTGSPVGSETFGFRAEGWGWLAGGGLELWPLRRVGVYVEGTFLSLKGTGIDNGQGSIDDKMLFGTVGVRVAIGRSSSVTAR